jgi:hypothetical protein
MNLAIKDIEIGSLFIDIEGEVILFIVGKKIDEKNYSTTITALSCYNSEKTLSSEIYISNDTMADRWTLIT